MEIFKEDSLERYNKYCPNCKSILRKNPKHAQGVYECVSCGSVFFILVTTKGITFEEPVIEIEKEKKWYQRIKKFYEKLMYSK